MDAALKKCGRDENGRFRWFFFFIIILTKVTTIHAKYISIFYSSIALIVDSMTILESAMNILCYWFPVASSPSWPAAHHDASAPRRSAYPRHPDHRL